MKKEEFKSEFIKLAKENPSIIHLLSLEKNLGLAERKENPLNEFVLRNVSSDLLIRMVKRLDSSDSSEFDIQFCDGLIIPQQWSQVIRGDLGLRLMTKYVVYEGMMFEPDAIVFYLRRFIIKSRTNSPVLETTEEIINMTKCCLDKGFLYFDNIKNAEMIRLAGRHKTHFKTEHFIDYPIEEAELNMLSNKLNEWGNRNEFTETKMQKINEFMIFCKKVKSTKTKSKMVRIMEYLRDGQFPYRY